MPDMRSHGRLLVAVLVLGVWQSARPGATHGQAADVLEPRVGALLSETEVESLLPSLRDAFLAHFIMLVPDLPEEDRGVLADFASRAFAPDTLKASMASELAAATSAVDVDRLDTLLGAGPVAELRDVAAAYEPERPFAEFSGDLSSLDRERLQLMVALVEAKGSTRLAINVDEALRRSAHRLLVHLGGDGDFVPMTDEQFDVAYRQRTLGLAVESMYRMEPAPDALVQDVVDAYGTDEASQFSFLSMDALVAAIDDAGEALIDQLSTDEPDPEPAPSPAVDPASAPPCRVQACGFVVSWSGSEPAGGTAVYTRPGELEDTLYEVLVNAGYRLLKGVFSNGMTIQVRAGTQVSYCDVVIGTNPRRCLAVGDVRVTFVGEYPGFDGRPEFIVRNRCRATDVLSGRGAAGLVASHIHYELTTYEGDERRRPSC